MLERVVMETKIRNRYREAAALSSNRRVLGGMVWTGMIVGFLALLATASAGDSSLWSLAEAGLINRTVNSVVAFPQVPASSDRSDILRTYPAYLQFALEVGKDVDPSHSKKLAHSYENLRKRSPDGAARFLKGLRFEMLQKMELAGIPANRVSTRTPEIRKWVGKFMKEWSREADEYLFRAVATPRAE